MNTRATRRPVSSALGVYVVLLISLQIFLITVAVDALQSDNETLAWTSAGISVLLASATMLFARSLRSGPTS